MALPAGGELVLLHNDPEGQALRALRTLLEVGGGPRPARGARGRLRRAALPRGAPPAELAELAARLGLPPRAWARRSEPTWRAAGLDEPAGDAAILAAMAAHPVLIERPILVRGTRAVVGRPPERVLELL